MEDPYEAMDHYLDEVAEEQRRWVATWPSHCRTCGGWGGFYWYENHGLGGVGEQMGEPCAGCTAHEVPHCGRCGYPLTILETDHIDQTLPCDACGWDHDDGVPQP